MVGDGGLGDSSRTGHVHQPAVGERTDGPRSTDREQRATADEPCPAPHGNPPAVVRRPTSPRRLQELGSLHRHRRRLDDFTADVQQTTTTAAQYNSDASRQSRLPQSPHGGPPRSLAPTSHVIRERVAASLVNSTPTTPVDYSASYRQTRSQTCGPFAVTDCGRPDVRVRPSGDGLVKPNAVHEARVLARPNRVVFEGNETTTHPLLVQVVEGVVTEARYSSMRSSTRCRRSSTQRADGSPRENLQQRQRGRQGAFERAGRHRVTTACGSSHDRPARRAARRGLCACTVSRNRSLIIASLLTGAGWSRLGVVTSFPVLVLSQALCGIGWSFVSGADVT